MQDASINLPMDAAQIVQQMLSRKRLLASQPLDFVSQGPQQNGPSSSAAAEPATGVLGQSMAAAFFGEAGLTEQELALVSDAVQQVLAEHEASASPSKLAASVGQQPAQQQAFPVVQSPPVAALQQQPQQQLMYKNADVRSGTGAVPAAQQGFTASSADLGRLSEIMAAEQELEQELMQLSNMQARKAELMAAANSASPAAAASSSSTPAAVAQQHRTANSEVRSAGGAVESADVTAEMLSAALEDPNASVDDIVGILSFVLSQNKGNKGAASTGGSPAPISAADQQVMYLQRLQGADPTAAVGGHAPGAAGTGSSMPGTPDSNIVRTSQTAGEMAARLLQQARAVHGLEGNSSAQAAATYGGNMAQQVARGSPSAWQAEGGLMYNRGIVAPAAADTASPWGSIAAAAADGTPGSSDRHTSPPGESHHLSVVDRLYGPHADKAAAQREVDHAREGTAWMTPAEIERAWRLGLRNKADGQPASRAHPGVMGTEVQEWLAYDSLMSSQEQQQQGCAAAKPQQTPELDAKLQQLYERNVDWKRRCEDVYARQRLVEEREELKPCTFVPTINQKSVKMVQKFRHGHPGRPGSALSAPNAPPDPQRSQFQRSASTGRLNDNRDRHERYVSEEQRIVEDSKRAAQESAIRAANAVAAVLGEEAGRQLMEEMLGKDLVQKVTVANDPVDSADGAARPGRGNGGEPDGGPAPEDGSVSPHRAWSISDAALRLYIDAFERRERAEQAANKAEAERNSRPRSVPRAATYRHVEPKVYGLPSSESKASGPGSPSKSGRGTIPSECTFKPQTNSRTGKFSGKFPSSNRTTQQQSPPATLRALDRSKSNNASRKLDKEFLSAVEQVEQQQHELNVGLRQLLSSAGVKADPNMLSPRTAGLTSTAGRSSGGGRSSAAGSAAASSAAAASAAASAAATAAAASAAATAAAAAVVPRSRSAPRGSSGGDDLNWNEFIERQGMFLLMKDAKAAEVAAQMTRIKKPQLSPGSKRILKEKQKASDSAQQSLRSSASTDPYQHCTQYPARLLYGSADDATAASPAAAASSSPAGSSNAGSPYLDRVQQQLQSSQQLQSPPGGSQQQREQQQQQLPEWASYSFKPSITRKAAAIKPRSFDDMSEGDRLRKEAKLEQLRIMEEARRLAGVTFSPDMSPTRSRKKLDRSPGDVGDISGSNGSRPSTADSISKRSPSKGYESVKAKIQLRGPGLDAYLQSLDQKRKDLEDKRRKLEEKRKEAEMAECTFKPTTTPVPAYLAAMQNMGYTARFIEAKMAEAAGMSPLQQQQLEQLQQQLQSPQQAHRAKMMQLEQQHRDMLAQQQIIMQQHRAGMMQHHHSE